MHFHFDCRTEVIQIHGSFSWCLFSFDQHSGKDYFNKKKGCRDRLKAMLVNMNKDDMKRNKFKEPKFLVVIKVFRTSTEFSL